MWRLHGLPVVGPVEAWAQCAETWALDDLVAMADALLGDWSTHAEAKNRARTELAAMVVARARRRGVAVLREALGLARENVKSPQETVLRLLFERARLPKFELNAEVRDDDGRWLGVSDFVLREARVVIEYEGDGHRTDPVQWQRDIARRGRYADAGWHLIRVTKGDVGERRRELVSRVSRWVGPERLASVAGHARRGAAVRVESAAAAQARAP